MVYFLVGIGGIAGALLRYMAGVFFFRHSLFPFSTLIINLLGSFLLAYLTTGLFKRLSISQELKTAIGTGFVGSFTTFSTLSVETVNLFRNGHWLLALVYIAASIFLGVLASRLGHKTVEGAPS
ncbi:fluoride efflux transporter FluC [Peribacillus kribbensis]|uniref:fluoride efflux transporter FluC n=1 Tax=Peribacillus kribbensis TaxID=356658 RepID=UPI00041B09B5|nr:CrcB family protein [Peribacillus kribbensis]